MNEIEVNFTEQEIAELMSGKVFKWEFRGIKLKLFKGEDIELGCD